MKASIPLCAAAALLVVWVSGAGAAQSKELARPGFDLEQRIACQTILEEIRWSHTLWPESNPTPKPDRAAILSDAAIRAKVETSLRRETALFDLYGVRIDAKALQDELNRMTYNTKAPERLREIYAALGNDATSVGECVARAHLADYSLRKAYDSDLRWITKRQKKQDFDSWWIEQHQYWSEATALTHPETLRTPIRNDESYNKALTDSEILTDTPVERRGGHVAVWTGNEMIVWGGHVSNIPGYSSTGHRYDPASDTWTPITSNGAPIGRLGGKAVWTGNQMIVWGGQVYSQYDNTGGAYNPILDSWTSTTTTNAPSGRGYHTSVWTGSEMIVWGGITNSIPAVSTGGRYNPVTDTWVNTALPPNPDEMSRLHHTAVWTGSEMIVWGGITLHGVAGFFGTSTGARYRPVTNTWIIVPTINAPAARAFHTAEWSGDQMIVWGGKRVEGSVTLGQYATGGRYHLLSNVWRATTMAGAPPEASNSSTAPPPLSTWTGSEMIVWFDPLFGGGSSSQGIGGRYNPNDDIWAPMATTVAPASATAVWSGNEMIVYGLHGNHRYHPDTDSWVTGSSAPFPIRIFVDDFE